MVRTAAALFTAATLLASPAAAELELSGVRRCWHTITLSVRGPEASESGELNPFTDVALWVTLKHAESGEQFRVPGYFAADGRAGESGATGGAVWRAHFTPNQPGEWTAQASLRTGDRVAIDETAAGQPVSGADGAEAAFAVAPTDKTGRDFRAHGRLRYDGGRYLRFAETGRPFIKAGPDSPETLLAFEDFDNTTTRKAPLKSWAKHVRDWRRCDPTWRGGKGKGLVGAVNYLAEQGLNSMSFIPYNAGGDGDNVWPMVSPDEPLRYDCSKLDQWGLVFDHAQRRGVFLHFKLQETENDDTRGGRRAEREQPTPYALDGGDLGDERRLYLREMVARFGHHLALNWNLGEENTQSPEQLGDMARYLRRLDAYGHPVVLHTFPEQQEQVYTPLLGDPEMLTGVSLQNDWREAHAWTKKWVTESAAAGHAWVVACDEQNPADLGLPPDADYAGAGGVQAGYSQDEFRKRCLWGTLLAGGWGIETYFGYRLAENDLNCQDFRSRDRFWGFCRHAIEFFDNHPLPLGEMASADELVASESIAYCLAKPGEVYLVYLTEGGRCRLKTAAERGDAAWRVRWYNPREGGPLSNATPIAAGGDVTLDTPDANDWLALVEPAAE